MLSTHSTASARPRHRRLVVRGVCAILLLAGLAWLFRPEPGPRYLGRSVRYWFPRLLGQSEAEQKAMVERWEEFATATPEAWPLLVAAASTPDSPMADTYRAFRNLFRP